MLKKLLKNFVLKRAKMKLITTTKASSFPLEPISYSDNHEPIKIALPQNGYITHLDCLIEAEVSASKNALLKESAPAGIIQSMVVKELDGLVYFDMPFFESYKFWLLFQYGNFYHTDLPKPGQSRRVYLAFPIHLGMDLNNKYDQTVPIPAIERQTTQMEIVWGSPECLGKGYKINDATMRTQILQIELQGAKIPSCIWCKGMVGPRWDIDRFNLDSSRFYEKNLPIGDTLHKTLIVARDLQGKLSDDIITSFSVYFPKSPKKESYGWHNFRQNLCEQYGFNKARALPRGIALIDWASLANKFNETDRFRVGLNLDVAQSGDVVLQFDTSKKKGSIELIHYQLC